MQRVTAKPQVQRSEGASRPQRTEGGCKSSARRMQESSSRSTLRSGVHKLSITLHGQDTSRNDLRSVWQTGQLIAPSSRVPPMSGSAESPRAPRTAACRWDTTHESQLNTSLLRRRRQFHCSSTGAHLVPCFLAMTLRRSSSSHTSGSCRAMQRGFCIVDHRIPPSSWRRHTSW